jgi:hypothetical protein
LTGRESRVKVVLEIEYDPLLDALYRSVKHNMKGAETRYMETSKEKEVFPKTAI